MNDESSGNEGLYVPPSYGEDQSVTEKFDAEAADPGEVTSEQAFALAAEVEDVKEDPGEVRHVFSSDEATAEDVHVGGAPTIDEVAEQEEREHGYDFGDGDPMEPNCTAVFTVIIHDDGGATAYQHPEQMEFAPVPRRAAELPDIVRACFDIQEDVRAQRIVQSTVASFMASAQAAAQAQAERQEAMSIQNLVRSGRMPPGMRGDGR